MTIRAVLECAFVVDSQGREIQRTLPVRVQSGSADLSLLHVSRPFVVVPRQSVALILALAVALWFASTLGLVHRTLHVPGFNPSAAPSSLVATGRVDASASAALTGSVAQRSIARDARHAPHGLAVLFGDHTDADCRLYDQLAHGSAMPAVPLIALPVFLPAATFAWLQGEIFARWVALLRARGPPSAR
jgi:hypothetical protein